MLFTAANKKYITVIETRRGFEKVRDRVFPAGMIAAAEFFLLPSAKRSLP